MKTEGDFILMTKAEFSKMQREQFRKGVLSEQKVPASLNEVFRIKSRANSAIEDLVNQLMSYKIASLEGTCVMPDQIGNCSCNCLNCWEEYKVLLLRKKLEEYLIH